MFSGCEGAGVDVFDPAAAIANEVMMVAHECIRQFVTGKPFVKLQAPYDAQLAKQLDRAVDRYPVNRAIAKAGVNLFDAERRLRAEEDVRYRASGLGQTITSVFE